MRKKILFSSFLLATSLLQADCCENPCSAPAPSCVDCAQLWPTCGPNWLVTPNAGPCVRDGADIFVTGEFIYWTVREDHLGFVLAQSNSKGSLAHPDWKFSPGFKVGLGMLFDHDGWDIYANYTFLRPHDITKEVKSSSERVLIDNVWIFNIGAAQTIYQQAFTKWDLNFNVVDLELGRNFFISRYLQLRPYFGLKGTWQEQEARVAFHGTASNVPTTNVSENKIDMWGVGLLAGLDTAWHFSKSFSLVGEVAASALWEGFEVLRKDFNVETGSLFPLL